MKRLLDILGKALGTIGVFLLPPIIGIIRWIKGKE